MQSDDVTKLIQSQVTLEVSFTLLHLGHLELFVVVVLSADDWEERS